MSEGEFNKRVKDPKIKPEHWGAWTIEGLVVYEVVDMLKEAKKDIYESIESHIHQLIEFWEDDEVNPEILREVKTYYIDAYVSLLHNHNDHDSFKIKKWFGIVEGEEIGK